MGEVGAGPTTPEETILQTAAFADSLLPHIKINSFFLNQCSYSWKVDIAKYLLFRLPTIALGCIDRKHYPIIKESLEQYTRVELVTNPWQGLILPLN